MVNTENAEPESDLDDVFDRTYPHFWADELGGERLERDIKLIQQVCGLSRDATVLDLGCGFGRIANRLALEGVDVTGVDRSADLLELARAAAGDPAPTYIHADMRSLDLAATFDVSLLWFSTFGYFPDADNQAVLTAVHAFLRPGGMLAIETRNWDRIQRDFSSWSVRRNGSDLLLEHHEFVPATGRQVTRQEVLLADQRYERSYYLRRYTAAELIAMLEAADFTQVAAHGEDMAELTVEHERTIVTGRRAR